MSQTNVDYVIVGSTPLAGMLAALLAVRHGRRVLHVGQSQSFYRLPRGIDLSVAPLTRPESWALLGDTASETLKLVGRIAGRSAWSHVDPIFFAKDPRALEALSHMRHMATGFGIATEPTATALLAPGHAGITLRDAVRLNRAVLEPALESHLQQAGVERIAPQRFTIAPDGSATLTAGDVEFEARQTILADDDAILAHLPKAQWPGLIMAHPSASILATTRQKLAAPLMLDIQSGAILLQQAETGIAAIGREDLADFCNRLGHLLGQTRQIELAGQTSFTTLLTRDGAPAVGRIGGVGADIIAGMGMAGIFLVPALARWLCGDASARENDWFGARIVSRSEQNAVGDYAPGIGSANS
jgi:hypothetical protein